MRFLDRVLFLLHFVLMFSLPATACPYACGVWCSCHAWFFSWMHGQLSSAPVFLFSKVLELVMPYSFISFSIILQLAMQYSLISFCSIPWLTIPSFDCENNCQFLAEEWNRVFFFGNSWITNNWWDGWTNKVPCFACCKRCKEHMAMLIIVVYLFF